MPHLKGGNCRVYLCASTCSLGASPMLLATDRSVLLIVDVQQRLLPAIHDGAQVLEHCLWLIRLAQRLQVPVVA